MGPRPGVRAACGRPRVESTGFLGKRRQVTRQLRLLCSFTRGPPPARVSPPARGPGRERGYPHLGLGSKLQVPPSLPALTRNRARDLTTMASHPANRPPPSSFPPDPPSFETTEESPSDGPWPPYPPTLGGGGGRGEEGILKTSSAKPKYVLGKVSASKPCLARRLGLEGPLCSPLLMAAGAPGPSPASRSRGDEWLQGGRARLCEGAAESRPWLAGAGQW